MNFALDGDAVKITALDPTASTLQFRLPAIPTTAPYLHLVFEARAAAMAHYPPERARLMQLDIGATQSYAWVNQNAFTFRFGESRRAIKPPI